MQKKREGTNLSTVPQDGSTKKRKDTDCKEKLLESKIPRGPCSLSGRLKNLIKKTAPRIKSVGKR